MSIACRGYKSGLRSFSRQRQLPLRMRANAVSSNPSGVMFFRLPHRHGQRRVQSRAVKPDAYLTDDRRLFRVVWRLHLAREHVLVALEDCATLDVRVYAQTELGAMGLRAVRAVETVTVRGDVTCHEYETDDHALAMVQLDGGA